MTYIYAFVSMKMRDYLQLAGAVNYAIFHYLHLSGNAAFPIHIAK